MVKRKPKVNEIDSGGGNPYPFWFGSSRGGKVNRAINEQASSIGSDIGHSYFESKVRSINIPSGAPKTVRIRGDVFTPSGVYKGKEVFISKPALTNQQTRSVIRGQVTKAHNQAMQIAGSAKTGAKIGIGVGGSAGLVIGFGGREIVEGLKTVVNQIRKSDKLPKPPKVPQKR